MAFWNAMIPTKGVPTILTLEGQRNIVTTEFTFRRFGQLPDFFYGFQRMGGLNV